MRITEAGANWDVDLTALDNSGTDNQNLSFSGAASPYTLEISGGDNVTFTAGTGITLNRTSTSNLTIVNSGGTDYNTSVGWNDVTNTFSVTDGGGSVSAVITGFMDSGTDNWVNESGDVMIGFLTLHADPTADLHAATKRYVDGLVGAISDNYVNGASFNTGSGVLTLTRTGGLSDITANLDGRYSLTSHSHSNLTFNNIGSGDAFGTIYNGSSARTISYNTIGAASSSHNHANLTAGTGLTGSTYNGSTAYTWTLTAISAGSASQGALYYNGTTRTAGRLYGGTTAPSSTTRLNYDGYFYATQLYDGGNRVLTTADEGNYVKLDPASAQSGNINVTGNVTFTGTVTIGGANPITINGATGKIDAKTVDPVIEIEGEKYATYNWDGIGLRTDVVGVAQLTNGEFRVDMAKQPKASDLWLFYHAVAETSIIPFVTPQDPVILMARVEGSELVVRSISGEENARFGYRLSGVRIDMVGTQEEINIRTDDPHSHIKVEDYDKNGTKLK